MTGGIVPSQAVRIALLADLREEGWPSMDLVADMLAAHLPGAVSDGEVRLLCPALRRRRR